MKKKQIGVFSGSFNPVHTGHCILANFMLEFTFLDEVWPVVTPQNPLKNSQHLLDDVIRLKMAEMAFSDFDKIRVSDIEFEMPRPSYTIDTLERLEIENPDCEFALIIGGDNWSRFHRWKDYGKILSKYKILIYPRLGEEMKVPAELSGNVCIVNAPIVEISSTFIRESIPKGKNVRAFLPSPVYEYILNNKLYH